jgi:hypothetical protein
MTAHAVCDGHDTGLGIDEVRVLVTLALATRIALTPRPQPH